MTERIDSSELDGLISSNDPADKEAGASRYATCAASFTASAPAGMRNGEEASVPARQTAFATSSALVISAGCGGAAENTCFAQSVLRAGAGGRAKGRFRRSTGDDQPNTHTPQHLASVGAVAVHLKYTDNP